MAFRYFSLLYENVRTIALHSTDFIMHTWLHHHDVTRGHLCSHIHLEGLLFVYICGKKSPTKHTHTHIFIMCKGLFVKQMPIKFPSFNTKDICDTKQLAMRDRRMVQPPSLPSLYSFLLCLPFLPNVIQWAAFDYELESSSI